MSVQRPLLEARLACAVPGDVLVLCREIQGACRRTSPCDGCYRLRVSRSTTVDAILEQLEVRPACPTPKGWRAGWDFRGALNLSERAGRPLAEGQGSRR